jgi:ABC-type nitrate/sulfonate/bicarbonate transport system ATPase subunit
MVFQAYTSFPWLTVEENVLFALDLEGNGVSSHNSARSKRDRAKEMLEFVDLADSAHKFPRELSGGMKQRVAIARALVCNPDILLMDEPFGALDPHIRVKMQELMLRIGQAVKTTVIFVTHDAREAVFLGDVIYISTVRPCFLKYRILHPFDKTKIDREKARDRYSGEFLRFQREVEDRMQFLIEHPETPRLAEKEDDTSFQRSTLGVLEQLSDEAES